MEWVLSKPLKDIELLIKYEKEHKITFPESYVEIIAHYNYGRPRPNVFNTFMTNQRIAKALLSFDEKHPENMWGTLKSLAKQLPSDVYPFMIDQFGNYICFYYDPLLTLPSVVFFNLEYQRIEGVADDFNGFLLSLYSLS
ncbi:SMI1/KNR4 family protein [Rossellomorea marisflavi]|uniref:SMI1/KNR4 family protein n=1 Tax=Rossellomorea marisflavi TaxID=189381 RepID=UPI00345A43D3